VLRPREYEDRAWDLSIAINDRKAIKSAATIASVRVRRRSTRRVIPLSKKAVRA